MAFLFYQVIKVRQLYSKEKILTFIPSQKLEANFFQQNGCVFRRYIFGKNRIAVKIHQHYQQLL